MGEKDKKPEGLTDLPVAMSHTHLRDTCVALGSAINDVTETITMLGNYWKEIAAKDTQGRSAFDYRVAAEYAKAQGLEGVWADMQREYAAKGLEKTENHFTIFKDHPQFGAIARAVEEARLAPLQEMSKRLRERKKWYERQAARDAAGELYIYENPKGGENIAFGSTFAYAAGTLLRRVDYLAAKAPTHWEVERHVKDMMGELEHERQGLLRSLPSAVLEKSEAKEWLVTIIDFMPYVGDAKFVLVDLPEFGPQLLDAFHDNVKKIPGWESSLDKEKDEIYRLISRYRRGENGNIVSDDPVLHGPRYGRGMQLSQEGKLLEARYLAEREALAKESAALHQEFDAAFKRLDARRAALEKELPGLQEEYERLSSMPPDAVNMERLKALDVQINGGPLLDPKILEEMKARGKELPNNGMALGAKAELDLMQHSYGKELYLMTEGGGAELYERRARFEARVAAQKELQAEIALKDKEIKECMRPVELPIEEFYAHMAMKSKEFREAHPDAKADFAARMLEKYGYYDDFLKVGEASTLEQNRFICVDGAGNRVTPADIRREAFLPANEEERAAMAARAPERSEEVKSGLTHIPLSSVVDALEERMKPPPMLAVWGMNHLGDLEVKEWVKNPDAPASVGFQALPDQYGEAGRQAQALLVANAMANQRREHPDRSLFNADHSPNEENMASFMSQSVYTTADLSSWIYPAWLYGEKTGVVDFADTEQHRKNDQVILPKDMLLGWVGKADPETDMEHPRFVGKNEVHDSRYKPVLTEAKLKELGVTFDRMSHMVVNNVPENLEIARLDFGAVYALIRDRAEAYEPEKTARETGFPMLVFFDRLNHNYESVLADMNGGVDRGMVHLFRQLGIPAGSYSHFDKQTQLIFDLLNKTEMPLSDLRRALDAIKDKPAEHAGAFANMLLHYGGLASAEERKKRVDAFVKDPSLYRHTLLPEFTINADREKKKDEAPDGEQEPRLASLGETLGMFLSSSWHSLLPFRTGGASAGNKPGNVR